MKKERYHLYGNPWGGYFQCYLCDKRGRWWTSAFDGPPGKVGFGFWWGWPMANIDGWFHSMLHRVHLRQSVRSAVTQAEYHKIK